MHTRIEELMTHLDEQRAVLRAAFDAVPPAARDRRPAGGGWSAAGIIEHLAIVENRVAAVLAERIASARQDGLGAEVSEAPLLPTLNLARLIDRSSRFPAPEISHPTGLAAADAWAALERAGATVRQTLRSADGLALGEVMHPHPAFGPSSVYAWFGFIGSHEARHAAQIRELAAAH